MYKLALACLVSVASAWRHRQYDPYSSGYTAPYSRRAHVARGNPYGAIRGSGSRGNPAGGVGINKFGYGSSYGYGGYGLGVHGGRLGGSYGGYGHAGFSGRAGDHVALARGDDSRDIDKDR